jgi:citrate lyase subunit beta / citryl-CoA lyase
MDPKMTLPRSWMFVPGDSQRKIDKALGLAADAILLDIEDGVAPEAKDAARRQIAASLHQVAAGAGGGKPASRAPALYVRINAVGHDWMHADLAAVMQPALDGLALPKIETPEQVQRVERILDKREPESGIAPGSVRLIAAIESARGVLNACAIAASSPRVIGIMFGAEDFCRELNLPMRREGEARDLIYARSALATAAAAARVQAVDAVWPDLQDMEGLRKFALQSRRLGFSGMALIHPSQIDAVNSAFTPTAEEVDYCRRVLEAFEEAKARGLGAVAFGGKLLDAPIVDRARQTVALAESLGM